MKILTAVVAIIGCCSVAIAQDDPARTLFTNVHVFDGVSPERIENANVLVEGNLIKSVSTDPIKAEGATVIDGGGRTMTPGFIDAHVHIMLQVNYAELNALDESYYALKAADEAEKMLMRGFTTARDAAGMLTVLWSGLEERRHEMAVLRAVGARPRHIFLLIIGEALLLTLGGVLVGIFFAALTLSALDSTLVQHYGLSLSAAFSGRTIVPLFSGLVAAGLLAGLLPAMRCYRRSLSDGLSPETGG